MDALRTGYGDTGALRLCAMSTKVTSEQGLGPFGVGGGSFCGWGVFGESSWNYGVEGDYGSYGWNGYLANPPAGKGIWGRYRDKGLDPNWRIATAKGAGDIPVLLDHQWVDCWPDHTNGPPDYDGQPWPGEYGTSQMGRFTVNRHDGYLNYLFLDWSVRKVGLKHSWRQKWHRLYDLTYSLPSEFTDPTHWMYKFDDPD
jgi:prepilin-type processing-associated H-X9-DG protein